ncbi:Dabb family protein [Microbacterium sp. 5K110]|jgi:heme-degrading monooxygenase HmoA|uniref:Dabb family protein n=1 Tax=unclassified Microbacterium TaxID=2609290 RepID=UPI0010FD5732|nr:Dabb family protein [Microbacterium sp. 5K110]TLF33746.1 Dabb family protein [Microbacterium sp. 5K110]
MILHAALFTWRPEVRPEEVEALTGALEEMATALPMLRGYRCGTNLRLRPSPADYAVIALVTDEEALEAYLDSPEHAAVYAAHLSRMIESRQAVQLTVPDGTTL